MFSHRKCLSLLVLQGLVCTAYAQNQSCLHRTLPISIHDSHGLLVRGFVPSDFVADFNRMAVKVLSIRSDDRPHRIVILLDVGENMKGAKTGKQWTTAIAIAYNLARSRLPNTSLALILFSDEVREQINFSQGNSAVEKRLLDIKNDSDYAKKGVRGASALLDAIVSALQLLGDSHSSDEIYLITQGFDFRSKASPIDVRNALASSGVRLNLAPLVPETEVRGLRVEARSYPSVDELAVDSGGLVLAAPGVTVPGSFARQASVSYDLTQEQLKLLSFGLAQLYIGMTRNDLLEVELPQTVDKTSAWSLQFSPASRKIHKDLIITYPNELAPCSAL
jgi:hypothetical protein